MVSIIYPAAGGTCCIPTTAGFLYNIRLCPSSSSREALHDSDESLLFGAPRISYDTKEKVPVRN